MNEKPKQVFDVGDIIKKSRWASSIFTVYQQCLSSWVY